MDESTGWRTAARSTQQLSTQQQEWKRLAKECRRHVPSSRSEDELWYWFKRAEAYEAKLVEEEAA
ncbi:MAG: hypothetical protein KME45_02995 [Stenomitos rutilans HA7619-LM2]|jgi:hypothetical protein|nr:hypothetical protein [Stenomitos rutilans HA7619-LM2]MBW4469351.1 hypothetical protein [Stenomitos rutilans HA7619-LM2]